MRKDDSALVVAAAAVPLGRRASRGLIATACAAVLALVSVALGQATEIERRDPDRLLRAMSTHLATLDSFTVELEVDTDFIDLDGQRITVTGAGHVSVDRPDRLHVTRRDYLAEVELYFDGTRLTLFRHDVNAYASAEGPRTIDDAIDYLRRVWDLDATGADLLYEDVYTGLVTDLRSAAYLGVTLVSGVEAHHLAFRAEHVDWQIWIATGDAPVPLRYTITSKWITGSPQFEIRLGNWNPAPALDAATFAFEPPADAVPIELSSHEAMDAFLGEVR
jgi:hypothetical protein